MPLSSLRLERWDPAYESAVRLEEDDAEGREEVATGVETDDWRAISPSAAAAEPEAVFFIDGVRRVDHGVMDEGGEVMAHGLLGSYAAGVTSCRDGSAAVFTAVVERRFVLGADRTAESISVPAGSITLEYLGHSVPENEHRKLLGQLQVQMRRLEGRLAVETADGQRLTIVDGPLTYLMPLEEPILGYVKTHTKNYVSPEQMRVVRTLEPGQRSPVFSFGSQGTSRYSWYLCVGPRGALDHSLSGVVRVEVTTAIGAEAAVRLADCSAALLPRYATRPASDPRAPQNLYPIRGLESRLHHLMGDRAYVRRSIAVHFHRMAA